ncbi:BrnA antitoxin family protein [Methylobacterium currus]|uniref:BrnA antitoxin family protein n=1 Tax=Methylobacterium currus TaxID=2051553 RepID=UPI002F268A5F
MTKRNARPQPATDDEEARIQAQIANDPDAPEITDDEAAQMRPFAEAFPDLHTAWKRRPGRPKAEVTKVAVKLRLDPDVVEGYRATGPGWQTRMNDVLRRGMSATDEAEAIDQQAKRDAQATVKRRRVETGRA